MTITKKLSSFLLTLSLVISCNAMEESADQKKIKREYAKKLLQTIDISPILEGLQDMRLNDPKGYEAFEIEFLAQYINPNADAVLAHAQQTHAIKQNVQKHATLLQQEVEKK